MDIKKNIEFQKTYFPTVYSNYLKDIDHKPNQTIEIDRYIVENIIYIISDNIEDILIKLFNVPKYIYENIMIDDINELHLYKDVNEKVEQYNEILEIYYPYVYLLNVEKIIISNKLRKTDCKNKIQIYNLKKLDSFEKRYIKDSEHKIINVNSNDELEKYLLNFNPSHYINIVHKKNEKTRQCEDNRLNAKYRKSIIGDLAKKILNFKGLNQTILVNDIITYVKNEYEKESNNISIQFLNDDFLTNFILIEELMNQRTIFIKSLVNKYLKIERYVINIRRYSKSKQIALSIEGEIGELEDFLSKSLNMLMKKMQEIEGANYGKEYI